VLPDGVIDVWELIAADPAAGAALWRDLLSRDLVGSVTADLRPADDPLLYQLHDSRRARVRGNSHTARASAAAPTGTLT